MIKNKACPECGSLDIVRISGDLFMCQACGYSGSFKEKPIVGMKAMQMDDEDEMPIKLTKTKTVKKVKKPAKEVKKNVKRRRSN